MEKKDSVASAREVQIHLQMDDYTLNVIEGMRLALEASSIGEVVRRAIQAHRHFAPRYNLATQGKDGELGPGEEDGGSTVTRLVHVRIPPGTKTYLDSARRETNGSFSEVVTQAIHVLATLLEHRRQETESGETSDLTVSRELALA